MIRTWEDNAFWENKEERIVKAILNIEGDDGIKTTQQVTVSESAFNGDINPDFEELIDQVGLDKIEENTITREKEREEREKTEQKRQEELKKAKELENLFESKLKAFEIEEIKNSNNRELKTKLRRAKNTIEVNIYSMMIVMDSLKNDTTED